MSVSGFLFSSLNFLGEELASQGISIFFDKLKEKKQREELKKRVLEQLEHEKETFKHNLGDLNFDFDVLPKAILRFVLDKHSLGNIINIDGKKRNTEINKIYNHCITSSEANNVESEEYVKGIVDHCYQVVEYYFYSLIPGQYLLAVLMCANAVNSHIDEKLALTENEIKKYIEKLFNELRNSNYTGAGSDDSSSQDSKKAAYILKLSDYVERQKELVQALGLLPYIDPEITFKKSFPELFVHPTLKLDGQNTSYEDLINSVSGKNLVIWGDAGSGKSTLLKYISQFESLNALYFPAQDIKDNPEVITIIQNLCEVDNQTQLFIMIDGVDEVYWDDLEAYKELINKLLLLKRNARFWIACRTDFYRRASSDGIVITGNIAEVQHWDEETHVPRFLEAWAKVYNQPNVPERVNSWANQSVAVKEMLSNPFQLTLLAYLASSPKDWGPINSIYDLYESFFKVWFKREADRKTGDKDESTNYLFLEEAAEKIYRGEVYHDKPMMNSSVSDLLVWRSVPDENGLKVATMFRHHSLAAYILAHQFIMALKEGNNYLLKSVLGNITRDDVTNFVIRKAECITDKETKLWRDNLSNFYYSLPENDDSLTRIYEKVIYYVSRFNGEATEFLIPIVSKNPQAPHMRLSLAYACTLSDNAYLRQYALDYAKALSRNEEDAAINRAWTVYYFNDSNKDPYTYGDEDKGPWTNSRAARIKRFTKKNPRKKDYRFFLFDLPLFWTFLITRDWNDISEEEYRIISQLKFPEGHFNKEEIEFLSNQKEILLSDYKIQLEKLGCIIET